MVSNQDLNKHRKPICTGITPGVPGQTLLCAPNRVHSRFWKHHTCWRPKPEIVEGASYVFCHNDLGQHNVIVDPDTLEIKAIIDWEYGGFWPEWFKQPYWERKGPNAPLGGEEDDRERCRGWLLAHCIQVEMEHLRSLKERLGEECSPPRLGKERAAAGT